MTFTIWLLCLHIKNANENCWNTAFPLLSTKCSSLWKAVLHVSPARVYTHSTFITWLSHLKSTQPHPESETVNLSHGAWANGWWMGRVLSCSWLMEIRWSCRSVLKCWERCTQKPARQAKLHTMCPLKSCPCAIKYLSNSICLVWSCVQN